MEKRHTLTDNTALRRYEFDLGGDKAVIEYILGPGYRILTHTDCLLYTSPSPRDS